VAALLGVIFCICIMDITTPFNCQVGTVLYVYSLGLWPATISSSGPFFQLWASFLMRFRPEERTLISLSFFPSSFSVCLRPPLRYWSFFARTSESTITQRKFSWIRLSLILLALQFGTEIRLCWWWQSLYGSPILRSTSKVSPFPPCRRPGITYIYGLGTDVIRVNGQLCCYSSSFGLIPSVVSLCLGPCTPRLWDRQDRSQLTCFHPHNNFRHGLASVRALRFTRHASSRRCYVWSGPPPLETGIGRSSFNS
jgi:hypothetical protein